MGHAKTPVCAACGAPATVHITFIKDGKNTSSAWCEQHAAETGAFDKEAYALLDRTGKRHSETTLRCPACDCSQRDFERQGRFGCPACYGAFAGLLPPLLRRMHRGVEHRGKIPARGADPATMRHRLSILQDELKRAVLSEKFEGAAQTRDTIAALQAKLLEDTTYPAAHAKPPRQQAT